MCLKRWPTNERWYKLLVNGIQSSKAHTVNKRRKRDSIEREKISLNDKLRSKDLRSFLTNYLNTVSYARWLLPNTRTFLKALVHSLALVKSMHFRKHVI
jgi:hypothetical protein